MIRNLNHQTWRVIVTLLLTLAVAGPAVATSTIDRTTYKDYYQFGNPSLHNWNSPWWKNPLTLFTTKYRIEATWATGVEYDVRLRTKIRSTYDPKKVSPGSTFPLMIDMESYNYSHYPEYELYAPGGSVRFRGKQWGCSFWSGCSWHTFLDWTPYDFLLLIQRDPMYGPGSNTVTLKDDYSYPLPPGISDLFVSFSVVLKHKIKDREIRGGSLQTSQNVCWKSTPSYRWRSQGQQIETQLKVHPTDCSDEISLTLPTEFHYKSQPSYGNKVTFFPTIGGVSFEYGSNGFLELIDLYGLGNSFWFDNYALGLNVDDYDLNLRIPVTQRPDLWPKSLYHAWSVYTDNPDDGTYTRFLPHLQATVKNQGCEDAPGFHVDFYGVNHGQRIARSWVSGLSKGASRTVTTGPLILWDNKVRVVVDGGKDVTESNESNNTRTATFVVVMADPSGTRLFDQDDREIVIDLPPGYGPGDATIVTPKPRFDSQESDPVTIRHPEGGDYFHVDFSYIFDVLGDVPARGYRIEVPSLGLNYTADPGRVQIPASSDFLFSYDVFDGTQLLSNESFQVVVDNSPPTPPNPTSTTPALVGDYNLDVALSLSDTEAVLATVQSLDGPGRNQYGPYVPSDGTIELPTLSLFPGDNSIEFVAFDGAGNSNGSSADVHLALGYDDSDNLAPIIRETSPADSEYVATSRPRITAIMSDVVDGEVDGGWSGIDPASAMITLNDTPYTAENGVVVHPGGYCEFTPNELADGTYRLQFAIQDRKGNLTTTAETQFHVDTVPPIVSADLGIPLTPGTTALLPYTIDEEAWVSMVVYAYEASDETYRWTVRAGQDSTGAIYLPAGAYSEEYNGVVPKDAVDYLLDNGDYKYVVRAEDRAGNASSATGTFQVVDMTWIVPSSCTFEVDSNVASGCESLVARVTLRDGASNPIAARMVGIKPVSAAGVPDVFFSPFMKQGDIVAMGSNADGQISYSVDRRQLTSAQISCNLHNLFTGSLQQIGNSATIQATSLCESLVSAQECSVSVVGNPSVCNPFALKVYLAGAGEPLIEATIGVRGSSDRNGSGPTYDYFFDPGDPQDVFVPVQTDTAGYAWIPVRGTMAGQATYSLHYHDGVSDVLIGSAVVEMSSVCEQQPDPENSTVNVNPVTTINGDANVEVTLVDESGLPMAHTYVALEFSSDRNDPLEVPPVVIDYFGSPPSMDPVYDIVTETDATGTVIVPVHALEVGFPTIEVHALLGQGSTKLGEATLAVNGVAADLIDPVESTLSIDPRMALPGETVTGVINLQDAVLQPVANQVVGLRIDSNRNNCEETPYIVDDFPGITEYQNPLIALMTDANGDIELPITSDLAGAAYVLGELGTSGGQVPFGWDVVGFDDDDFDNVPFSEDLCYGRNDNVDCDSDGVPDGCDPSNHPDVDQDGISDYCDNCPTDYNPYQIDMNDNGLGFCCDLTEPTGPRSLVCEPPGAGVDDARATSSVISLTAPQPNPFGSSTQMTYVVQGHAGSATVKLRVYDVAGRLVRVLVDAAQPTGLYQVAWDGTDNHGNRAAAGVYFVRLDVNDEQLARRIILLR